MLDHVPTTVASASTHTARRVTAACFLLSIVLGLASNGSFHDDDLTHYLMARWSGSFPEYLLHIWGRPGFTLPMAAIAWMGDRFTGWHMARFLSALVTAAGSLLAAQLAGRCGVGRTWLVVLVCYAQPLNLVLSYTTLTENWTALYLIGAVTLLIRGNAAAASFIFSLALVTRHEAVIFLPFWWTAVFLQRGSMMRTIGPAAISLWAPLFHNLTYYAVIGEWPARMYFLPRGSTEFLPAGALSYLPHALYAVSPVILAFAFAAVPAYLKRDRWLIAAIPLLFLFTHATIKALGLFASGGYGRFMVAVAPFFAILATASIERFSLIEHRRRLAVALTILVVLQLGIIVRPLRQTDEHRRCAEVAQWLNERHQPVPMFVTHPWIVYHLAMVENPRIHKGLQTLAAMPAGTIVVWDSRYGPSDYHGLATKRLRTDLNCRPLHTVSEADDASGLMVIIYLKESPPMALTDVAPAYPPNLMSRPNNITEPLYQIEH